MKSYLILMSEAFQSCYLNQADVWTADRALRRSCEIVMHALPQGRPLLVLDIGAGRAADGELFLRAGHSYTAVDLIAHEKWADLRLRWGIRFQAYACPFQEYTPPCPDHYDLISDSGCFHHQHPDDFMPYLTKIESLLKPGGLFALNVYTPADPTRRGQTEIFADGRFAHVWNIDQLRELAAPFPFKLRVAERIQHENGKNSYLLALFEKDTESPPTKKQEHRSKLQLERHQ